MEFGARRPDRWAIILAGGEGLRLRPLTRRIAGEERPKQFCPFLDGETLLDRTRARVARTVRPDRTCLVLTRSHERFYAPLLAKGPLGPPVVQPRGRGTAPAILYGLLRVADGGSSDAVALFPSDHYVSDDARFMAHVEAAFATVETRPDLVVLLGMEADGPEVQYGWIEAGDRFLDRPAYPVYRVRRFWEKPALALAETLFERGCLWNSFVLVARVPALLALIRGATPDLYGAFMAAWLRRSTLGETEAMRSLYARLPSTNFSEDVLGTRPANLAVLPVRGVTWSDWGDPARVLQTLGRLGVHPEWAEGEATLAGAGSRSGQ
jgi:mannose-1-phosphate guanylyltransferase